MLKEIKSSKLVVVQEPKCSCLFILDVYSGKSSQYMSQIIILIDFMTRYNNLNFTFQLSFAKRLKYTIQEIKNARKDWQHC